MGNWSKNQQDLHHRIEINPEIMTGKPVIRGTRIPVELLVKMLAQGMNTEDIMKEYPHLTPEDVQAALLYAAESLDDTEVFPIETE